MSDLLGFAYSSDTTRLPCPGGSHEWRLYDQIEEIDGPQGNDLTFERKAGSQQTYKVHFLDLKPNASIITCLIMPDTYAPEKGLFPDRRRLRLLRA
jgi:hypothetical protein